MTTLVAVTPEERYVQHENLVRVYAWRLYLSLGLELADALALGALGLWQAVHREHPNWEAFARVRVTGAIQDGARLLHGRHPARRPTVVSLEHVAQEDNRWPELLTHFPDEEQSYSKLHAALKKLDERSASILRRYYLADTPLQDIAADMGVTSARVSFLKARALRKLRDLLVGHAANDRVARKP